MILFDCFLIIIFHLIQKFIFNDTHYLMFIFEFIIEVFIIDFKALNLIVFFKALIFNTYLI